MGKWKQEQPTWCPHKDCRFKRRAMDKLCGGELPEPEEHDGGVNTHRFCINAGCINKTVKCDGIFDLQVNSTDLQWFRWIFDALDGKKTSWLSKRR